MLYLCKCHLVPFMGKFTVYCLLFISHVKEWSRNGTIHLAIHSCLRTLYTHNTDNVQNMYTGTCMNCVSRCSQIRVAVLHRSHHQT